MRFYEKLNYYGNKTIYPKRITTAKSRPRPPRRSDTKSYLPAGRQVPHILTTNY
jgi:hypothetical protein